MTQWAAKAGNDVALTRVPVTFGSKQWEGYAKAFYVGEALDIQVVTNHALFELARRGGKLETAEEIADFFVGLCIERKVAEQQINSFVIKSRMAQGDKLAQRYKVQAVPSFVVNDKYFTDASMVGSPRQFLRLLRSWKNCTIRLYSHQHRMLFVGGYLIELADIKRLCMTNGEAVSLLPAGALPTRGSVAEGKEISLIKWAISLP